MFLFKKIVAPFFFPLSLSIELLLLGLLLLWGTNKQKPGKILVTLGTGLLVLLSYHPVPDTLLQPLEGKYPPLTDIETLPAPPKTIKWIVVLDGDKDESLPRVFEGVRLYKHISGAKLLMSGGSIFGREPGATASARLALILGVKPQDLVLESESRDTEEEARLIQNIVGKEKFILVTSASHMVRSMLLFQKVGLEPIAAPAGYLIKNRADYTPGSFFPSAKCVRVAETAVYEYLGLIWSWFNGLL